MDALLFNVKADISFLHYLDFVDIVNFSHSHKASLFILKDNTLLRSLVYARCNVANITPNLDISKVMLDLYYQFRNLVLRCHEKTILPSYVKQEKFIDYLIRDLYYNFITEYVDSYSLYIEDDVKNSNFNYELINTTVLLIPVISHKVSLERIVDDLREVGIIIDISLIYSYFKEYMEKKCVDMILNQILLLF